MVVMILGSSSYAKLLEIVSYISVELLYVSTEKPKQTELFFFLCVGL